MEKEFVPYEQALELKELGFDESTYTWRQHGNGISGDVEGKRDYYNRKGDVYVALPTYSQAFRWFREKYNLFCEIQIDRTTAPKFCFNIFQYEHFGNYEDIRIGEWYLYRTYEEAELECLKKLIEIVKNK